MLRRWIIYSLCVERINRYTLFPLIVNIWIIYCKKSKSIRNITHTWLQTAFFAVPHCGSILCFFWDLQRGLRPCGSVQVKSECGNVRLLLILFNQIHFHNVISSVSVSSPFHNLAHTQLVLHVHACLSVSHRYFQWQKVSFW